MVWLRKPNMTYIPTWAGFLYLAVVLDTFSRRIVGWAMETHLRTELVLQAAQPGPLAAPARRRDSSFTRSESRAVSRG